MSLAGLGAVCIWHDLLSEAIDEFYQWHNREHMPERLGIAGFRRGRRFIAVAGTPTYFNLYEADNAEVLGGRDYLERLNSPTAWTRRVVASFRRVSRSICRVAYSEGVGEGGFMLTQRFDVDAADAERTSDALRLRLLPPLGSRKGIAGVHLCLADEAISGIETAEKKSPLGSDRDSGLDRSDRRHVGDRRAGRRRMADRWFACTAGHAGAGDRHVDLSVAARALEGSVNYSVKLTAPPSISRFWPTM